MELALIILADIILLILLVWSIWFFVDSLLNSRPNRIMYVSSNVHASTEVLYSIVEHYISDTSLVSYYEPGSGLSHIARHMATRFAWKDVVAIDASLPILIAAYCLNLIHRSPVRFVWGNLFMFTYPNNSLVYCYLSVPIMRRLYNEGRLHGCLVVSLSFPIPDVKATETISMPGWQKQMLIYDFRDTATS